MKISDIAAASGLSLPTIRYYERAGLCPPIPRGPDGKRAFTAENRDWLVLLASLRETGMPMQDMRRFAKLYRDGDVTIPTRRALLQVHASRLDQRQASLDACRDLLAHKLTRYDKLTGENT